MSSEKSDTRTNILRSTWKLLETGTASGVRMVDIAKAAGVSRQAVYLHFPNRSELLIATTRYIDEVKDTDIRLAASRSAKTGIARLNAFIEAWGNYIPEIYGVGRALMAMQDTDKEARIAWADRMQALRQGCEAAVKDLSRDRQLVPRLPVEQATDILWVLLSVRNWEQFTIECGWPQDKYIKTMKTLAARMLVANAP